MNTYFIIGIIVYMIDWVLVYVSAGLPFESVTWLDWLSVAVFAILMGMIITLLWPIELISIIIRCIKLRRARDSVL